MEWALFVVAVLLVAALQFVVWRRLRGGEVGVFDAGLSDAATPGVPERDDGDPGVWLCPACGAENDADYRFCRECAAALQP